MTALSIYFINSYLIEYDCSVVSGATAPRSPTNFDTTSAEVRYWLVKMSLYEFHPLEISLGMISPMDHSDQHLC